MSLSHSFFERRAEKQQVLEAQGYVDLEDCLQAHGMELALLFDMGLLQDKEMHSTGSLYNCSVTAAGRRFIYLDADELLLVRPGQLEPLLQHLQSVEPRPRLK